MKTHLDAEQTEVEAGLLLHVALAAYLHLDAQVHELDDDAGEEEVEGPECGQVELLEPFAAHAERHRLLVVRELGHVLAALAVQRHQVVVEVLALVEHLPLAVVDLQGGEDVRQRAHDDLGDLLARLGQAVLAQSLVQELAEDLLPLLLGL